MSTTVSYKGSTIGTVDNESKKIDTKGTWLEDDIVITDSSSGGGSVVVVDTPDSHGGTIREITAASVVSLHNTSTITPTQSAQTIVPLSGYSGFRSVTVEAIPSAYVIPSGSLSITENGTYNVEAFAQAEVMVSGGGGLTVDDIAVKALSGSIAGNTSYISEYAFYHYTDITSVSFSLCTSIGSYAFCNCSSLSSTYFPICTNIGPSAFTNCFSLTVADFPSCTTIGTSAFYGAFLITASFPKCTSVGTGAFALFTPNGTLEEISLPVLTSTASSMFYYQVAISKISLPACRTIQYRTFQACYSLNTVILNHSNTGNGTIYSQAFSGCYNLLSLYLLASNVYTLSNQNAFASTPISNYTTSTGGVKGNVFVKASLYSAYSSATNWAAYATQIVSLTDTQVQNVLTYGKHDP